MDNTTTAAPTVPSVDPMVANTTLAQSIAAPYRLANAHANSRKSSLAMFG